MCETWKYLCEGSPYEVSDLGRVRKNGKLKKCSKCTGGYPMTKIHGIKKTVHSLVLSTFTPNPMPWFFDRTDHINRDRADNRLENLRWSNATLNQWNSNHIGYFKNKCGSYSARIKIEGSTLCVGAYKTEEEARARYLEALRDARMVYDPHYIY